MFSPEKSQVEICLLKSHLEEIENELLVQRSAWPKFDAENDQKFRESLNLVKASRAISVEIEKVNQENVRLVAKRMHLKMQSKELARALEKARKDSNEIDNSSNCEKQEIEQLIRKYEDMLRDKTARFRETRAFFNDTEMKKEIEKVNDLMKEIERDVANRQSLVETLKRQLDSLSPNVPENLAVIIGKNELDEKVKSLLKKFDALQEKRNDLVKNMNNGLSSTLKE